MKSFRFSEIWKFGPEASLFLWSEFYRAFGMNEQCATPLFWLSDGTG